MKKIAKRNVKKSAPESAPKSNLKSYPKSSPGSVLKVAAKPTSKVVSQASKAHQKTRPNASLKKPKEKASAARLDAKPVRSQSNTKSRSKIDDHLLNLPHSSMDRISRSLEKIENFSSELAERKGITGILGRAVLLRASAIRESLGTAKSARKPKAK